MYRFSKLGGYGSKILKLHKNRLCYCLAVKTTCFTQYLSYLNLKGEDSSCNINGFIATYISKLKWAWQGYFLSHALLISKFCTTFKDVQMMLKRFFDISTGFIFSKISVECSLHPRALLDLVYLKRNKVGLLLGSFYVPTLMFPVTKFNPNFRGTFLETLLLCGKNFH